MTLFYFTKISSNHYHILSLFNFQVSKDNVEFSSWRMFDRTLSLLHLRTFLLGIGFYLFWIFQKSLKFFFKWIPMNWISPLKFSAAAVETSAKNESKRRLPIWNTWLVTAYWHHAKLASTWSIFVLSLF